MASREMHVQVNYYNDTYNMHEPDSTEDCDWACRTVLVSDFTLNQWRLVNELAKAVHDAAEHLYNTGTF